MRRKNYQQQQGFTLIELLITIVILAILASVAILYGPAILKGSKDKLAQTRLATVAEAQNRFKGGMGRGRYGSVCELARTPTEDGSVLLPASVAKFDESCAPVAIDGWFVRDNIGASDPSENMALRKTYMVHLLNQESEEIKFCMGPDGILRKPTPPRGGVNGLCTMNSPEAEQ